VTWRHRAWAVAAVTFAALVAAASHMIGAGVSAWFAAAIRESSGSYDVAWWIAGGLSLLAALASAVVPRGKALTRRSDPANPSPTSPTLTPTDAV
jgi:hypothetical protein